MDSMAAVGDPAGHVRESRCWAGRGTRRERERAGTWMGAVSCELQRRSGRQTVPPFYSGLKTRYQHMTRGATAEVVARGEEL